MWLNLSAHCELHIVRGKTESSLLPFLLGWRATAHWPRKAKSRSLCDWHTHTPRARQEYNYTLQRIVWTHTNTHGTLPSLVSEFTKRVYSLRRSESADTVCGPTPSFDLVAAFQGPHSFSLREFFGIKFIAAYCKNRMQSAQCIAERATRKTARP